MCDIEFTVENGKPSCSRHASESALRERRSGIAVDMLDAGLISEDEALQRVTGISWRS